MPTTRPAGRPPPRRARPERAAPLRAPGPESARRPASRRLPPRRDGDSRVPGQVGGDGADVVHVHGHGVVHFVAQREGRGGSGGTEQHVDRCVGPPEGLDHHGTDSLRLRVIGVVVPGRQRIGAEHDAALDLGPESGRPGGRVHGRRIVGVDPQAVAHAVVAGQVGRCFRRRDQVVRRQPVGELGDPDLLDVRPGERNASAAS